MANLHTQEFDLRSEQDPLSKTVPICLEIKESSKPAVASTQTQSINVERTHDLNITPRTEGIDHSVRQQNSNAAHGRLRSEAGRQRQRERWLSRRQERANRQ